MYSKTCLKQPLKIVIKKILMTNDSLMKVKYCKAFCNTFDLHKVIIGLENRVLVIFLIGHIRPKGFTVHVFASYAFQQD